jgi:hypothetical protein
MTKDEALKLALEALETLHDENMDYLTRNKLGGENNQCMVFAREAITAIKEALAQPEQEPVAWMCADESLINKGYARFSHVCMGDWKIPVYTTPPQPEEKLITIVDIEKIVKFKERNP